MKICHVCNCECEDNAELCPICGADLTVKSEEKEEIEEKVDVDRFLSTIEDKDKQILQMRAEGYTNQEIADRLGYKTHSAVVKRIKKLGKMYQDSSGLNFGF